MRISKTGATRDSNHGKYDYFGFNHPVVEWFFSKYMYKHRKQADGTMRAPDNWWKGFDDEVEVVRSADRHLQDIKLILAGHEVIDEDGKEVTIEDAACGVRFGMNALLLGRLRETKKIQRGEQR